MIILGSLCLLALWTACPVRAQEEAWQEHLEKGIQAGNQGKLEEAEKELLACLKLVEKQPAGDRLAEVLSNLAVVQRRMGRLEQAQGSIQRALEVLRQGHGPEAQPVAEARIIQANILRSRGNLQEALESYRSALPALEKAWGAESPDLIVPLQNMAGLLSEGGLLQEAEKVARRALMLAEKNGWSGEELAGCLNELACVLQERNRFEEAERLQQKALSIREQTLGRDHPQLAESLNNLAGIYYLQGKYAQQLPLLERALEILRKARGPDHPLAGDYLNNIAVVKGTLGRFDEAIPLHREALGILEKALGPDHPRLIAILSALTDALVLDSRYFEAEPVARRGVELAAKSLGPESQPGARLQGALAGVLAWQGRLDEAEVLARRALEILEKIAAPPLETARALETLATLELQLGRPEEAQPLLLRTAQILRKIQGEEHPRLGSVLHHQALAASARGRFAESEQLLRQALALSEKVYGKSHRDRIQHLMELANLYDLQGKAEAAVPLYQEALTLNETTLGPRHPDTLSTRHNLSCAYRSLGRWELATPLAKQAAAVAAAVWGPQHHDTLVMRMNVASLEAQRGNLALALAENAACLPLLTRLRDVIFRVSSERGKRAWVEAKLGHWHRLLALALRRNAQDPQAAEHALDTALSGKGMVVEALAAETETVLASRDPALKRIHQELAQARRELAASLWTNVESPNAAAAEQARQALEQRVSTLETDLARGSSGFARQRIERNADGRALRQALRPGTAFVSYVRFRDFDFPKDAWAGPRYLALLARTGQPTTLHDLGPAEPIDAAVGAYQQEAADALRSIARLGEAKAEARLREKGKALAELILVPLLKELSPCPRWLVAPDGPLSVVPLSLLPLPQSSELVIDRHEVDYLVSGREVVAFGAPRPAQARQGQDLALLFADPDFDLALAGRGKAPPSHAAPATPETRAWPSLPATRKEAQDLERFLKEMGLRLELRLGGRATKQDFLAQQAPRLLHVATHGFFLADAPAAPVAPPARAGGEPLARAGACGSRGILASAALAAKIEDPMLRSGLVFAGANSREGQAEGLATARELLSLDLCGTDLVVLSACETGLGVATSGEGILGLRRSFLVAGARTLLTSLWRVPDRETGDLMRGFYARLLKDRRGGAALRAAMLELRQTRQKGGAVSHPYYWGGFILVGDPD